MAKYLADELELQSVADAIRAKGGTSESLTFPSGFVSAIEDISVGGGDHMAENELVTRTISEYTNSEVTSVGSYAFYMTPNLTTVSLPACTNIKNNGFYNCRKLLSIYSPACTSIGNSAFNYCTNLTMASFPACTSIGNYAFGYCTSLITASFPVCTSIGDSAFYNCFGLTTANFPVCTNIGNYAFGYCSFLTTISFPACTSIGNTAFHNCIYLLSVYFMGSSIPTLASIGAFASTPIAGYTASTDGVYGSIYVPASMLESYKTASQWSYFSDRFVGVE